MSLTVLQSYCKGCSICIAFCPKQVLGLDEIGKIKVIDETKCIKCKQCEMRCPDYAIFLD